MSVKNVSMNDLREEARIIAQETIKKIIKKTVIAYCPEMPCQYQFVLEEVIKELKECV